MYVVRRPFRNNGNVMLPGSCVEPDSIKRFKTRMNDRYIVEVNAHNFDQWNAYFVGKFGVTLERVNPAEAAANTEATDEVPAETEQPVEPLKPVVKVVAAVNK